MADGDVTSVLVKEADPGNTEIENETWGVRRRQRVSDPATHDALDLVRSMLADALIAIAAQVTLRRVAVAALSGHRAVTPGVDGSVGYAEPATIGNQPVWVTTSAADADDLVPLVALGTIVEPSWSWVPGNVYLAASGVLTQTEPTSGALVVAAVATDATSIFVNRQPTIDL